MNPLENFYNKTFNQELINKFNYQNILNLPKLKKIILNFNCRTSELKHLSTSLLALELISKQKGTLTRSKRPNIVLKIRKGQPSGCKIILRKKQMFKFFEKIINEILPKLKNFEKFKFHKNMKQNAFSYQINDIFNFSELEQHYHIFNNISNLNIIIVTDSKTEAETFFLLKSLQLPLKI